MTKKRKKGRAIDGILLLDKPKGLTSNDALQQVKRIYEAEKAGHSGSLDPLASGMLPICFGESTKFCQYLLEADKYYYVTATLGVKTTTGDAEGDVVSTQPVPILSNGDFTELWAKFTGTIEQIPSMYSAIKHNGQPLYKLARQGIEIERPKRAVQIHELRLLESTEQSFTFDVRCSKGTYIRTLVEDMGDALGCGAYVSELRRLSAGPYKTEQMVTLAMLEGLSLEQLDALLLPAETSVSGWPEVQLSPAAAYYLQQGQAIILPAAPTEGWVRLSMQNGRFLGIGEVLDNGWVAPRRLVRQ